jgi:parallel beta-helix repeat protein
MASSMQRIFNLFRKPTGSRNGAARRVSRPLLLEALEERIVLDADVTIVVTDNSGDYRDPRSLGAAIKYANDNGAGNKIRIQFAIPEGKSTVITPGKGWPTIINPVIIDARGDDIILYGGGVPAGTSGLTFSSGLDKRGRPVSSTGSVVWGMQIQDFGGDTAGIRIKVNGVTVGGDQANQGNTLFDNNIGVSIDKASNTVLAGNTIGRWKHGNVYGVMINGSGLGTYAGNKIGSPAAPPNIISFNQEDGIRLQNYSNYNVISNNEIFSNGFAGIHVLENSKGTRIGKAATTDKNGVITAPSNWIYSNRGANIYLNGVSTSPLGGTEGRLKVIITDTIIQGNFIGTPDGVHTTGPAGSSFGIEVYNGNYNTIGGTGRGEGNVISVTGGWLSSTGIAILRSSNTTIQGNLIGTDKTGTARLTPVGAPNPPFNNVNTLAGISVTGSSSAVMIGGAAGLVPGTEVIARPVNVISGNAGYGIRITATGRGIRVKGNFIGTDIGGTKKLGNGKEGSMSNTPVWGAIPTPISAVPGGR